MSPVLIGHFFLGYVSAKDKNLVIFQFISVVLKELQRHRTRSALTISGVALSVCVLVSLLGLGTGYRTSLIHSIDRLGYHVLVTSKGCPYPADARWGNTDVHG